MRTYCVKEGKHDFWPPDGFMIYPFEYLRNRELIVYCVFGKGSIFDHMGDDDLKHDQNFKLHGFSLMPPWRKKNKNAVMVSARPYFENQNIGVTAYANIDGRNVIGWDHDRGLQTTDFIRVKIGELFRYKIYPHSRTEWIVRIEKQTDGGNWIGQEALYQFDYRPTLLTKIGTWFGGYDNDGNGLGGVAPQDICLCLSSKIRKRKR